MRPYNLDTVRDMVAKDHQTSQQLLALLKQETPCIKKRNYDGVKKILNAKTPLLETLQQHAEIRKQWLMSLYKLSDEKCWQKLLDSFNDPDVVQQWQQVDEVINQCKSINETNGLLITRGQKTYNELLHILKGGRQESSVYNPTGNQSNTTSSCTYTKA